MEITFTPEIEAFLKARFETDDISPVVQQHLNHWVNHLIEVAYLRVPPKETKVQEATADIITKKEEADIKKDGRLKDK